MKLLYCPLCMDLFKLDHEPRHCKCGEVKGGYYQDGIRAWKGKEGVMLGLNNLYLAQLLTGKLLGDNTSPVFLYRINNSRVDQKDL